MTDYANPRYSIDKYLQLWHGPTHPDENLHYSKFDEKFDTEDSPIWTLWRSDPPEHSVHVSKETAERYINLHRRNLRLRNIEKKKADIDLKKSPDYCPWCGGHAAFCNFADGRISFSCGTECQRSNVGWISWIRNCTRVNAAASPRVTTRVDLAAIEKRLAGATPTPSEPTPNDEVWMIQHLMEIVQAYRKDVPDLLNLCRALAYQITELEGEATTHYHDMQAIMGDRNVAQAEADDMRERVAILESHDSDGVEYWRGEYLAKCDELNKIQSEMAAERQQSNEFRTQLESKLDILEPKIDAAHKKAVSVAAQLESAHATISGVAEAFGCLEDQVVNVASHLKDRVDDLRLTVETMESERDDAKRLKQKAEKAEGEAYAWKREWEMYKSAWIRELGGVLINKTHLIDALVLTTRKLKEDEKAAQARAAELEDENKTLLAGGSPSLKYLFKLQEGLPAESRVGIASGLSLAIDIVIEYVRKLNAERTDLLLKLQALKVAISDLKVELGTEGRYTIIRKGGETIDLIEAIRLGGILERIDQAIAEPLPPTVSSGATSEGVTLIANERRRHFDVEGWTPQHDDVHVSGELAKAAAAYVAITVFSSFDVTVLWPKTWSWKWFKPKDPIRNLVRAGAMIAAEIDRLLRKQQSKE